MVCYECMTTALFDGACVEGLVGEVREMFRRLGLAIKTKVPVYLVGRAEISRHYEGDAIALRSRDLMVLIFR